MKLPTFVVVGAGKCGTTSLHQYLSQHPAVFLPSHKELHHFSYDWLAERSNGPGDRTVLRSAIKVRRDYDAFFTRADGYAAVGEVSPSYLIAGVAARLRDQLGSDLRIVVCLRSPVRKAFSQYLHLLRAGREPLPFADALKAEPARTAAGWSSMWWYLGAGMLHAPLQLYLTVFGAERVHVVVLEELAADPARELRRLCTFIGVDPLVPFDTSVIANQALGPPRSRALARGMFDRRLVLAAGLLPASLRGRIRRARDRVVNKAIEPLDETTRRLLVDAFTDEAAALARVLGRRFPWPDFALTDEVT